MNINLQIPPFAWNNWLQLSVFKKWWKTNNILLHFQTVSPSWRPLRWETGCRGTAALVEVKGSFRLQSGLHCDVGAPQKTIYFFFPVKCLTLLAPRINKKTPKNHPGVCTRRLLDGWINAAVRHLTWAPLGDRSYLLRHSSELNCISRKTWANAVYSRVTRRRFKEAE